MLLATEAVLWDDGRTVVKLSGFFQRTDVADRAGLWRSVGDWAGGLAVPSPGAPGSPCKLVLNRPLDVVYAGRVAGEEDATVRSAAELATPVGSSLAPYDGMPGYRPASRSCSPS